jgi:type I restriction enzyme S subunit
MAGEAWTEWPFPDVIDFQEGPGILAKDFREEGVPLVRLSGLERGASLLDGCNFLDPTVVERRWSHFALQKGDILLSTSASLGRIALVSEAGVGAIPYTGIIRMRPRDERVFAPFIRYLLEGPDFQWQAEVAGAGSVIRHFGPMHLRRMTVRLPPPSEQRAIAHILGTLDDKIELNRRMNETLEAMARAIFKSWFIDFDPVRAKMEGRWQRGQSLPGLPAHLFDLWPDSFQDSPLGKIPKGWVIRDFPDEVDFLEGPGLRHWQYRSEGVRFLNIRCIEQGDLQIEKANCISEDEFKDKYTHFALQKDDIVISTSGTLGRLAIVREDHLPVMLNTSIIRMQGRKPIGLTYAWATLQSEYFLDEMFALASGSVQLNFGPMHLRRIKILRPPDIILERFEQFAQPTLRLALQNRQQSRVLASIRDALLPKLISGEIRVKEQHQSTFTT